MARHNRVNDLLQLSVLNSRKYDTVHVTFANGAEADWAILGDIIEMAMGDPDVIEIMDNQTGELYKHPRCVAVEA